jgi:glutamate-ammonia-ligase adenylyltransferase
LERFGQRLTLKPGLLRCIQGCPEWLSRLFKGIALSELIADLLIKQPALIEGMQSCGTVLQSKESWKSRGQRILNSGLDYEQSMEWIRRLKNERLLMLAVADLNGL